ncbi:poliovirus receptor isoform X3 [Loxodonta africana]|uniref:poliovirus receptor isoform X3 n=1 Tax=Loxodonta africana TaxID=9785 RepID=UPI000C811EDD|nr:poliovirus receptor homolog [Loxodonta africana]
MGRAAPLALPLVLLSPLSLFWAPPGAGAQGVHVEAPAQVLGFLDANITLPCHLQSLARGMQVVQVLWLLEDTHESVAMFHPMKNPSFSDPARMEFVATRRGPGLQDGSLVVRSLRANDEANYTCEFVTFPQGSGKASTSLRVLAKPQNQPEVLETHVQLNPEPVPVARCVSTGGRPPAHISWSSPLDWKANMSQEPGPLPGTVNVISHLILVPSSQIDGKKVTCKVEHESFKEPELLNVTLTVHYPPEVSISGYNDSWYLGLNNVNLSCDARSNPKPTAYMWNTTMGRLPPSAVPQGHQLLIHTVDESINTTFICSVSNAIETGQAELTVLVRDRPPGEQSHLGIKASRITALVLALLLPVALLLYFLVFKRKCCLPLICGPLKQLSLGPADRWHEVTASGLNGEREWSWQGPGLNGRTQDPLHGHHLHDRP